MDNNLKYYEHQSETIMQLFNILETNKGDAYELRKELLETMINRNQILCNLIDKSIQSCKKQNNTGLKKN